MEGGGGNDNVPAHGPTEFPISLAPCAKEAVHAVRICTKEYVCSVSFGYLTACS